MAHPPPIAGELVVVALKAVSLEQVDEKIDGKFNCYLIVFI